MSDPLTELSLEQLRRRTSIKWRRYPADVLPVWVAELDVPLAEPIVDAVTAAVAAGDTGYATGGVYASALQTFAADRWGWDLEVARTALLPDVMLGFVELLKLVTQPGDAVVVNPPVYPPFYGFVRNSGREVVEAPLGDDGRLDLEVLGDAFAAATARHRAVAHLLCSPHNPTGTVHTREELEAVARLAEDHGVRVIADEIHAPLVLPGERFVPYLDVDGAERGFALLSASKGWNLAGLKAAVAVAGEAACGDLDRMPEEASHGASHLGVLAHVAALREGVDWLDALRDGIVRNQRRFADLLHEHLPLARYRPGAATYLAWVDCRALGLGRDPAAAFLDVGRVAVTPGEGFGTGGDGFVRVNLGTSPEVLAEAVRRMQRTVDDA
jgi:cystathionine beta-lyase